MFTLHLYENVYIIGTLHVYVNTYIHVHYGCMPHMVQESVPNVIYIKTSVLGFVLQRF